ncbi:hypothetical protein K4F52_004734 [Lecanicillium sp. MT-2017a]|nr:hypothetical protein K4F52_004734 [Lecanicillium sp. MT-2017a]
MGGNDIDLNQADMWDDSALVDSWNDALAEYKKYHSIHAKGGRVRDLEALSKARESVKQVAVENATEDEETAMEVETTPDEEKAASTGGNQEAAKSEPPLAPPITALGTVRDENLKKLLMSWYYAGYYTGLYEGQQQAQQQQQPQS